MFASIIVTIVVALFLVANIRRYKNKKDGKNPNAVSTPWSRGYLSPFLAGIVTANGLFHFLHGILGYSDFPAPFAKVFGQGIPSDFSNIAWGLFNLLLATLLIIRCRKSITRWKIVLFLILGTLVMGLLLRFVLMAGYFSTHSF